ncbi:MAG: DUF4845 domain-containing protein [Agarilytica sp.]
MKNEQKGFLSYTQIVLLFSLGVFILLGVKIIPVYSEHIYVEDALKFLAQNNSDIEALGNGEIKSKLGKYMTINSVGKEQAKSFSVKRMKGKILISSIYEIRVPIIHNIDAVMSFKSQLDTSKPDECCKYLVDVTKNDK